jgi:L-rhamnose isomerase
VGAWATGMRATLEALLFGLLEPTERLRTLEAEGDYLGRMPLLEEIRTMPFGAVSDTHCKRSEVPVGGAWIEPVRDYEKQVLSKRSVSLVPAPLADPGATCGRRNGAFVRAR